jgi:hypothetical protein
MAKPADMPPPDAVVVDNSTLAAVAQCDTYDYVTYCCHLRPKGTALAIEAGSAAHAGLADWLRHGAKPAAIERAMATIRQAYEPAVRAWELRQEKPIPEGDRFRPEWVYGVLGQWLRNYSGKFPYKVVGSVVERPVAAPLATLKDGRPLWIAARLDARVRKFASGGKWNLDWKTTKRVTDWWKDKTKIRSQFLGQLWIGERQGEHLEGVILGVIEIPEKHRAEYCKTHKRPFKECDLEHAGSDWVFITPHRGELPIWEMTAVYLAKKHLRLLALAEREGIEGVKGVKMQGRFNESCTFCEHKDWCNRGRPTKPANVRATFEKRVWDPLKTVDG